MTNEELIRLIRHKFGGKLCLYELDTMFSLGKLGLYRHLVKSCHVFLPPESECPLTHLFQLFKGEKDFLYTSGVNCVNLSKYREVSMKHLIPMMESDEDLWKYMVDRGQRKKPTWGRDYAIKVLASVKP